MVLFGSIVSFCKKVGSVVFMQLCVAFLLFYHYMNNGEERASNNNGDRRKMGFSNLLALLLKCAFVSS